MALSWRCCASAAYYEASYSFGDARVRREAAALAGAGWRVLVVGTQRARGTLPERETLYGFDIQRVSYGRFGAQKWWPWRWIRHGLQAGQIIRVDNELMRITVVTTLTKTLTVNRGWNGSTPAAHLTTVAAKIWRAQGDIIRATLIQAARFYSRANAIFGTVGGGEMGAQIITIPTLDPDVASIIDPYIYRL